MAIGGRVQTLMSALLESAQHEPFPDNAFADGDYLDWLAKDVQLWAMANNLTDDIRFKGA